jgi:predicted patatin/cPLA2 family phospholipase
MTPIDKTINELITLRAKHEKALAKVKQPTKNKMIVKRILRDISPETVKHIKHNTEALDKRLAYLIKNNNTHKTATITATQTIKIKTTTSPLKTKKTKNPKTKPTKKKSLKK